MKKAREYPFGKIYANWDVVPIPHCVYFQEGPGLRTSQWTKSGMKVINVKNILLDGTVDIDNTDKYISLDEFKKKYSHFAVQKGDIVVSSSGWSYGKVGRIQQKHLPLMMNTSVIRFKPLTEEIDADYLFNFLRSEYFLNQIEMFISGVQQPNFGPVHIKRMQIIKPPLATQRQIADILSSYDELVENNTRRIHILEKMAQVIYQELFGKVDKKSLPEGWKLDILGSHISVDRGISHKGEFMNGDGLPLLNLKSFSMGGGYRADGLKTYSGDYKSKHVVHAGDIVLANTDLTQAGSIVGNPAFVPNINDEILFTHHLYAIRFRSDTYLMKYYLYHLLSDSSYKSFAKGRAIGTTVLGLAQDGVLDFEFVRPPKKIIMKFDEVVSPIYQLKDSLEAKNANLHQTRDLLLPRLVSGEIKISDKT